MFSLCRLRRDPLDLDGTPEGLICHLAAGSARVSVVPGVVVAAYLLLLVVVIPLGDGRGKPKPGDNLLQLRTCSV